MSYASEAMPTRMCSVQHIYMCDSKGLVTTTRGDELPKHKQLMARKDKDCPNMKDLKDVVAYVKPHAIVGLTGGGEAWGKVGALKPLVGSCMCLCNAAQGSERKQSVTIITKASVWCVAMLMTTCQYQYSKGGFFVTLLHFMAAPAFCHRVHALPVMMCAWRVTRQSSQLANFRAS